MSDRVIVMDASICEQCNLGNTAVAQVWRRLVDSGAEIWVSSRDVDTKPKADQRAMLDLHTRVYTGENYKNDAAYQRAIARAGIPNTSDSAARLAIHMLNYLKGRVTRVELMTMDPI